MKFRLASILLFVGFAVDAVVAEPPPLRPIDIVFHRDTLRRVGGHGDNWCLTWTADDSQITSMDDGNWLDGPHSFNNHLYRISGDPGSFKRQDIPGYPRFYFNEGGWFGYGIVAVDNTLYSFVSKCPKNHWSGPFRGVKLLKSPDHGASWFRVNRSGTERRLTPADPARYRIDEDEMFFFEESGRTAHGGTAYPFAFCSFVQNGQNHRTAPDEFIYVYSPEGSQSHQLLLARTPKNQLGVRSAWKFFAGWQENHPQWTPNLEERAPVLEFPSENSEGHVFGWYSWLPSVVWNPGLHLYLMVNGGTYGGHGLSTQAEDYYSSWMHTRSGSLGFWYAPHPWGPWTRFFYSEEWIVDNPDNRTYQPKLSPKWISPDGHHMVLIWSDAMKNSAGQSHTVNYRWNQMEISIPTSP